MPTDWCNMNCVYCFNSRKDCKEKKVMDLKTLKKIFTSTIPYYDEIKFIFHGGEPLSMGISFYKEAFKMQKEINKNGALISNSIQTNLTLLDEDLLKLLMENNVKIGSSFDGTQNHLTRHNTKNILKGKDLVFSNGASVGFICVCQSKNIEHLIEDYEFFKSQKLNYTLNPYLTNDKDGDELYVESSYYVKKVCELFDYWLYDKNSKTRISYFIDFIDYILFNKKSLCSYNSCLGKHIGVLYDGKIFQCNRDFPDKYSYGNIFDYTDIRECFNSQGFKNMLSDNIKRREKCKKECEIYDFCTGGCPNVAHLTGDMKNANEDICLIIKGIYSHIKSKLRCICENKDQIEKLNSIVKEKIKNVNKTTF